MLVIEGNHDLKHTVNLRSFVSIHLQLFSVSLCKNETNA